MYIQCKPVPAFILIFAFYSQVFYDLMREIRSRKMEASRQNNGKKTKKNEKRKKCTIL